MERAVPMKPALHVTNNFIYLFYFQSLVATTTEGAETCLTLRVVGIKRSLFRLRRLLH